MTIKGLIFDFDGLILDTETADLIAWQYIYQKYGQVFNFEKYASAIGHLYEYYEPVLDLIKQAPTLNKDVIHQEWATLEKQLVDQQPIAPGIKEYLQTAKSLGLKLAVASSSENSWVTGHLRNRKIIQYFDFIHTVDETHLPKPDPALYLLSLKSMQLISNEVIAFEDSPNGVTSAKSAGIFCIAIPNHATHTLNLEHADLILDSLEQISLPDLLNHINNSYL
jgi:HAD superfamily hydrolase (TIGR01509 family)